MLRRIARWWFQPYVDAARLYIRATHEEDTDRARRYEDEQ